MKNQSRPDSDLIPDQAKGSQQRTQGVILGGRNQYRRKDT